MPKGYAIHRTAWEAACRVDHCAERRGVLGAGAILPREKQTAAEVLHRAQPESKVRHGRHGAHHLQHALDAGSTPSPFPPALSRTPRAPNPAAPRHPPPRARFLGTSAACFASQLMTDPILSKKLVDDRLANRTNSKDGLTFEGAVDKAARHSLCFSVSLARQGPRLLPVKTDQIRGLQITKRFGAKPGNAISGTPNMKRRQKEYNYQTKS